MQAPSLVLQLLQPTNRTLDGGESSTNPYCVDEDGDLGVPVEVASRQDSEDSEDTDTPSHSATENCLTTSADETEYDATDDDNVESSEESGMHGVHRASARAGRQPSANAGARAQVSDTLRVPRPFVNET